MSKQKISLDSFALLNSNVFVRTYFPFIFFLFGTCYFNLRILGPGLKYIPGDLGDSRFINYLLEHGYQFLSGHLHSFWNGNFMYPYKPVIALSDNMLGTLPVYAALRGLGWNSQTSFQLWWVIISALNYWSCFVVLKKWMGNYILAVCGAFIFAYGLFNLSQLNYMQMVSRFMVPPVLFAAYKLVTEPKLKYLAIYCFGLLFQFYCVMYLGFLLLYFSLLFILLLAVFNRSVSFLFFYLNRKNVAFSLAMAVACALLLYVLVWPYFITSKETGFRLYKEVVPNLPAFYSYFFSNEASVPWHFLSLKGKLIFKEWWLQDIFPGMLVYAGFALSFLATIKGFVQKRKMPVLFSALFVCSLALFFLFTRTENNLTFYGLLIKLPGMNSLRVLTRFMHVQLFFLIVLGISAVVELEYNKKIKTMLLICLPFLVILDNLFDQTKIPRTEKSALIARVESLKTKILREDFQKYKAVVYLPMGKDPVFVSQLDMMIAAQGLGIQTVNGYSSSCPPAFGDFFLMENQKGLDKWLLKENVTPGDVLILR